VLCVRQDVRVVLIPLYQALDGHRTDTSDVRRIGYRRRGVVRGYCGSAHTEGASAERVTPTTRETLDHPGWRARPARLFCRTTFAG